MTHPSISSAAISDISLVLALSLVIFPDAVLILFFFTIMDMISNLWPWNPVSSLFARYQLAVFRILKILPVSMLSEGLPKSSDVLVFTSINTSVLPVEAIMSNSPAMELKFCSTIR